MDGGRYPGGDLEVLQREDHMCKVEERKTLFKKQPSTQKRGPGRPRKQVVSESSSEEEEPDDPSFALPTDPNPASAPQSAEDPLFMDHYYCRNHQETLAMIQQKEKKVGKFFSL